MQGFEMFMQTEPCLTDTSFGVKLYIFFKYKLNSAIKRNFQGITFT